MKKSIQDALNNYINVTDGEYRPLMLLPKDGGIIIGIAAELSQNALNMDCSYKLEDNFLYGYNDNGVFFVFRIEDETLLSLIRNTMRKENPDIVVWVTGSTKENTGFIENMIPVF